MILGFYTHHLNPVLEIHWYGLFYVLSYFLCLWVLQNFIFIKKYAFLKPDIEYFTSFLFLCLLLGGRAGYFLLYFIPQYGFSSFFSDPFLFFRIWEGGMSSHGAIFSMILGIFAFSLFSRQSWKIWGDSVCLVSPIALFFGRIGNFINGELYGRITSVPWAMKFPLELRENPFLFQKALNSSLIYDSFLSKNSPISLLIERSQENFLVREAISFFLNARHPSQLYEALLEGLFLFLLFFFLLRKRYFGTGWISVSFLILYPLLRIFCEIFREPDSPLIAFLTKGQFYSIFVLLAGIFFGGNLLLSRFRNQ